MLAIGNADPTPAISLPAYLYSSCGKLNVEITRLGDDRAVLISGQRPTDGSFAFLVRNGIKVPAVVAWGQGKSIGLSFEQPFDGDRREILFRSAH